MLILACPAAIAQGLGGGGQGAGSGGTTGGVASPKGSGLGGTNAGSGNGAAAGTSTGPGSVNQNRFGGGAAVPAPPPATTTSTTTIMNLLNAPRGGESYVFPDRCAQYRSRSISAQERVTGANLDLLNAAQVYLAPNFDAGNYRSGLYLLANYQEEMDSESPDRAVAASYLALVATRSITEDVVARVNAILCTTASMRAVREIAKVAEEQRVTTLGSTN